jgi:hypothetical protein
MKFTSVISIDSRFPILNTRHLMGDKIKMVGWALAHR